MKTMRERREEKREVQLEEIRESVAAGTLVGQEDDAEGAQEVSAQAAREQAPRPRASLQIEG